MASIMTKLIIIFLCLYYANCQIVNTTQGFVSGLQEDGYTMYLGIPYAKVDEENPFGPSQPHPPFEGVFNAIDDSAICPQIEEFNSTLTGSLDCLHLSVFVPGIDQPLTPLPVLVWIYGGRFEIGFYGRFLHGPKYLVRHGVILVTLNYRLGPYGFMCTDDSRVPGNQGLKDQLSALKWINENIANFGGDPNKITLVGNSAGGMSIDFHVINSHEPRLFQQVILQSGTSLTPSFSSPDKNAPLKLSQHFGFETESVSSSIDFLTTIEPLEIVQASISLGILFRPCLEESFDNVEPFISYNWVENDTSSFAKELNVIIGFTNDEALFAGLMPNPDVVINTLSAAFDVDHEDFTSEDQVRHFFFGDEDIMGEFQGHVDLISDMTFIYPSLRSLDKFLRNDVAKAYLYMFSYRGGRNFVSVRNNITIGGAAHADEIGYLFDISYFEEPSFEDQLVLDRMTEMWANFVKYGDPTPQTSNLLPTQWLPITTNAPYYYIDIGSDLVLKTRPYNERHVFWDVIFEKYRHLEWARSNMRRSLDRQFFVELFPY